MTTQEWIDKAGCCAGNLGYQAVIDEQDGVKSKKSAQAKILIMIQNALICYRDGGNCLTEKQVQQLTERISQICGCCCDKYEDINQSPPPACDVTTLDAGFFSCAGSSADAPYIQVIDYSGQFKYLQFYYVYEYSSDEITWITFGYHSWKQVIELDYPYYRVTAYCFQGSSTYWQKSIQAEDLSNIPFIKSIHYRIGNGVLQELPSTLYNLSFPYNSSITLYEVVNNLKIVITATTIIPVPFPSDPVTSFLLDDSYFAGISDYHIDATLSIVDNSSYNPPLNVCTSLPVDISFDMIPQPQITGSLTPCYGDVPQGLTCVYGTNPGLFYSTYQWYKDGVIMVGENSDVLQVSTNGDYYCSVTKGGFTLISDTVTFAQKAQLPIPVIDVDNALAISNGINPESYYRVSDVLAYIHTDVSPYYTSVDYGLDCTASTYLSEQSGVSLSAAFTWVGYTSPTVGQNYLFVNSVDTYLLNYTLLGCTSENSNGLVVSAIDAISSPVYFMYNSIVSVAGYTDTAIIRNGLLTSCDGVGVLTATTYNTNIVWMQLDPVTLAYSVVQIGGASYTAAGAGIYVRYAESLTGDTDYHGFFIK